jgi:hypothetical protein
MIPSSLARDGRQADLRGTDLALRTQEKRPARRPSELTPDAERVNGPLEEWTKVRRDVD